VTENTTITQNESTEATQANAREVAREPVAVCVAVNEWTTEPRYVYPADDKNPPAGTKLYANPLVLREPSYEECELICSAYNSQPGITHMGARMFNAVREVMT